MTAAHPPSAPSTQPIHHPLHPLTTRITALYSALRTLEQLSRPSTPPPGGPSRYEQLPPHVKTPSQMLGRLSLGCEGTKGVFPRCNFSCKPCYHSSEANKVRVDGMHTVTEIARQMSLLRRLRGPTGHCQLIGGEVSLLPPEDHALALSTMRFFGRIPMSFTHGDFDYEYLKRLALKAGKPRFNRLDFAVHFDMGMRGRSGITKPLTETHLTPHRRRFVQMFRRLRREFGVRYYLAHNMTIQPSNLPYLADAVHEMKTLGFRLMSFQPAAQQGSQPRWVDNLRTVADNDGEIVWKQLEKGMGFRLPYKLFQMGDVRCNRMAVLGAVGMSRDDPHVHFFPLFDDLCPADVEARDLVVQEFGNVVLEPQILYLKVFRTMLLKPWLLLPALRWCLRVISRAGGVFAILRRGIQPLTIVMHRFMDAADVEKAWDLMDDDVSVDDPRVDAAGPRVRETIERLRSCSYAMAQPERNRVVPACVQHSIYDPEENIQLAQELSLREPARPASDADLDMLADRKTS